MDVSEAMAAIREIVEKVEQSDREELFEDLSAYVDDNVVTSFESDDDSVDLDEGEDIDFLEDSDFE